MPTKSQTGRIATSSVSYNPHTGWIQGRLADVRQAITDMGQQPQFLNPASPSGTGNSGTGTQTSHRRRRMSAQGRANIRAAALKRQQQLKQGKTASAKT